jgi:H+/Cl- antiporter ClcA
MKKLRILLFTVVVSAGVALTYYFFEFAVQHSTEAVWNTWLQTDSNRLLVLPICILITTIFFGLQHFLDPKSEKNKVEGLGSDHLPKSNLVNFSKVLVIGFFSLLAGASLGPEAILIPASMILSGIVAKKVFKGDKPTKQLLGVVALVALFTAFFSSLLAGVVGLLFATKLAKLKLNADIVILSAVSSVVTLLTLRIFVAPTYFSFPSFSHHLSLYVVFLLLALVASGYGVTYLIYYIDKAYEVVYIGIRSKHWLVKAFVAGSVLSLLYILGGPLVEFTGNQNLDSLAQQSSSIGIAGLVWLLAIKVAAISWSRVSGYRGGMIFPSVFAVAVAVAIGQLVYSDLSFHYGLIAGLAGLFLANTKLKVLF